MNTDEHRKCDNPTQRNYPSHHWSRPEVSATLGSGFLEKVYANSLAIELRRRGHQVWQQHAVDVRYEQEVVGEYLADLVVDGAVIVELKAVMNLDAVYKAQCLNYLRATGLRFALLLKFGRPRLEVHRTVSGY